MDASSTTATFAFPTTIRFGVGTICELPRHLQRLGVSRPLIVTDPGLLATDAFARLSAALGRQLAVFSGVHPNPVEGDVDEAARAYAEAGCDSVVAFGGGSALDVGKAVRLLIRRPEQPLRNFDFDAGWSGLAPCIAIPTTAGTGSEVGRSSVVIIDGRKRVIFHPALLADLVILDPELTRDLPPKLTAATGADALSHCIEAFTSPVLHPLCDGVALEGIHLIANSLAIAVETPENLEARGQMQIAAVMGGIAFQKDLGATHSLAHPLSSICGLHHGLANALCLPHVMRLNANRRPGIYRRVSVALGLAAGTDDAAIDAVCALFAKIGLSSGLRAQGVDESQLDALVAQAFEDSSHLTNPVPVTRDDLRMLYERAL